jgi:hypothetical protein
MYSICSRRVLTEVLGFRVLTRMSSSKSRRPSPLASKTAKILRQARTREGVKATLGVLEYSPPRPDPTKRDTVLGVLTGVLGVLTHRSRRKALASHRTMYFAMKLAKARAPSAGRIGGAVSTPSTPVSTPSTPKFVSSDPGVYREIRDIRIYIHYIYTYSSASRGNATRTRRGPQATCVSGTPRLSNPPGVLTEYSRSCRGPSPPSPSR